MDTQSAVHWHWPIISVSAAFMGKNACDEIATTSQKCSSPEHHQFLVLHLGQSKGYGKALTHNQLIGDLYGQKCYWRYRICLLQLSAHQASTILWVLSKLHSNELHRIVIELSLTRSVFSICPCIQLHKYACNVSQIWLFCLKVWSQYLRTCSLLFCIITFGSLSSRITLITNSYSYVWFKIFKHLIARGSDLFQQWTCLSLWFERPYYTYRLRCLVGYNQCKLEAAYGLEQFQTCAFVAILFTLQNWGDWQPWHHMDRLSSSSWPSIRTWDQLNGETLAGKSYHRKVEQINRVTGYRID